MEKNEKNEWITVPMFSREYECSHAELCIEVNVFEDGGGYPCSLAAEPVYYKLVGKGGRILMDGSHSSRETDKLWKFIEAVVAEEYTDQHLDWMLAEDPAFEELRRLRNDQDRLDNEWYRASVL